MLYICIGILWGQNSWEAKVTCNYIVELKIESDLSVTPKGVSLM